MAPDPALVWLKAQIDLEGPGGGGASSPPQKTSSHEQFMQLRATDQFIDVAPVAQLGKIITLILYLQPSSGSSDTENVFKFTGMHIFATLFCFFHGEGGNWLVVLRQDESAKGFTGHSIPAPPTSIRTA